MNKQNVNMQSSMIVKVKEIKILKFKLRCKQTHLTPYQSFFSLIFLHSTSNFSLSSFGTLQVIFLIQLSALYQSFFSLNFLHSTRHFTVKFKVSLNVQLYLCSFINCQYNRSFAKFWIFFFRGKTCVCQVIQLFYFTYLGLNMQPLS